jgi:hypothetical protein
LVHLGEQETLEAALAAWPPEIEHLERIGRTEKASRLDGKLAKLQELLKGDDDG